jgi:hypothetical protein
VQLRLERDGEGMATEGAIMGGVSDTVIDVIDRRR